MTYFRFVDVVQSHSRLGPVRFRGVSGWTSCSLPNPLRLSWFASLSLPKTWRACGILHFVLLDCFSASRLRRSAISMLELALRAHRRRHPRTSNSSLLYVGVRQVRNCRRFWTSGFAKCESNCRHFWTSAFATCETVVACGVFGGRPEPW